MLLAIKDVPPTVTPTQAAIIIKYIGKDFAKAQIKLLVIFFQQNRHQQY